MAFGYNAKCYFNKIEDEDQPNENCFSFLAYIRITFNLFPCKGLPFLSSNLWTEPHAVVQQKLAPTQHKDRFSSHSSTFLYQLFFHFLLWPISLSLLSLFLDILAKLCQEFGRAYLWVCPYSRSFLNLYVSNILRISLEFLHLYLLLVLKSSPYI